VASYRLATGVRHLLRQVPPVSFRHFNHQASLRLDSTNIVNRARRPHARFGSKYAPLMKFRISIAGELRIDFNIRDCRLPRSSLPRWHKVILIIAGLLSRCISAEHVSERWKNCLDFLLAEWECC
jgi:hypothetical protein